MDDLKAKGEIERRKSVEIAIADSRMEGFPPPSGWELEILDAFIRGEIEAKDLMEAVKAGLVIEHSTAPVFCSPPKGIPDLSSKKLKV